LERAVQYYWANRLNQSFSGGRRLNRLCLGTALPLMLGALEALLWLWGALSTSFLTLGFSRLWHVFNVRDQKSGFLRNEITENPYVWEALVFCSALLLVAVYVPGLSDVLDSRSGRSMRFSKTTWHLVKRDRQLRGEWAKLGCSMLMPVAVAR